MGEDVGDAAREGDEAQRHVGHAVDQAARGKRGARGVEQVAHLLGAGAAEQQDEFLAAVARHMAAIVGELRERLGDHLDHPVAGVVAVGVVDLLEVVDVAERHG